VAKRQPRSLTGKVVAITGGARGIGRATATALIAQGALVAIGDIERLLVMNVAGELGSGTLGLELDVTQRDSFSAFLDETERQLGPIDVFINNAGIMPLGPYVQERDEVTARVLDVNVGGVLLGCKLALERLLARGAGDIVNVASAAGKVGFPGGATYSASKHAVVGISEALRAELAGTNIEVHIVMPTVVATDMGAGLGRLRGIRTLQPSDVADAIVDGLRTGRVDIYVPKRLGPLIRTGPLTPRAVSDRISRALGGYRVLARADPLTRAAYEARIGPPPASDPAATVASAAASVADAIGD
jgi:NAD(P)-dependent dehydrogenase (short-subunit alcohol dehydrogenase family)